MVQSQFSLTWNSYKNSICSGFTSLQQNGELVDMTLAADGHFVKVHQVLLALASPYLKELITSAPCQHPVLFLNNVSYKNMSLILEYIYTGEVLVPVDNISSFAAAARGLHIKGLENLSNECLNVQDTRSSQLETSDLCHVSGVKRLAVPTSDGIGQIDIPAAARKIYVKQEPNSRKNDSPPPDTSQRLNDYSDVIEDNVAHDTDDDYKTEAQVVTHTPKHIKDNPASNLQYTVSIRGSLQVILNRYIYNLQSATTKAGLRRWRCIDYRNQKCMAFVVTKDNVVLNRANLHNHGFHDKKILMKMEKKCIFSAIDDVQNYKETEGSRDSDSAMDEGFEATSDFK
ncbi:uncharacterized protein LOC132902481 [Amyelois transitella]|uniref:uncharacterized protein LOC132902481 n=1 Tax=Amyelois transitella TaxID=680683 RepID=UPI0029906486|nr:uncharacterized protein LOC132902481 [Amyelois transitella]